ncbi:hypothetical protein BCV73_28555 [Paenibacillus sp. SSG-1]|nr:hypothetical protein BCV73_28555 [Paenibacillus sp. SSG-1]
MYSLSAELNNLILSLWEMQAADIHAGPGIHGKSARPSGHAGRGGIQGHLRDKNPVLTRPQPGDEALGKCFFTRISSIAYNSKDVFIHRQFGTIKKMYVLLENMRQGRSIPPLSWEERR